MILILIILFFRFADQLIKFETEVKYLTLMIKKQNMK